ncbi:MAG: tRNA (adenosine(37)-N6)-threonylcarbamoyltransferase complex ATPase subunit type 1 TsaE [Synergistetes bacterium]|nr:tRNA (adenosine(37)-N6)-threonylcarbamoyltransferase complex ATPase subunit type 1 TsaE [Synergistota bacterium]
MDINSCVDMVERKKEIGLYSRSEGETERIGRLISSCLNGKEVIFLTGDLGAGKTVLVRGVAIGAGVKRRVRSSSFVLLSQYMGGIFPIYHLDLYRIDSKDLVDLCIYDFLEEGVLLVEWADKAKGELTPDLLIEISIVEENERFIHIQGSKEIISCLERKFQDANFID